MQQVRLGVLVPAANFSVEPEMYKMAPEGVTVHFHRLTAFKKSLVSTPDPLVKIGYFEEAGEEAVSAAQVLAQVEPKVIAFGDTSASFFKGVEYNENLIGKIKAATGIQAITTSTAMVEALRELKLQRICLITPYIDYLAEKGKEFLEASGFEVPICKTLSPITHQQGPRTYDYEQVINAYDKSCDGIFCSCTGYKAIDIIERVERHLGKPMISSNQATMWLMLKLAEVRKPITGFGELMEHL